MPRGPATLAVAGQPRTRGCCGADQRSRRLWRRPDVAPARVRARPSQPGAVDVNSLLVDHADALLLAKPCRTADLANMIRAAPAPDSIMVNV